MPDTKPRTTTAAALLAVAFATLLGGARGARADMALVGDKWWPDQPKADAGEPPIGWPNAEEEPTEDALRATEDKKIDATYETVKGSGGLARPAGMVLKVRSSDRLRNEDMRQGYINVDAKAFMDAADNFEAAAAALQGLGKQEALYLRVEAFRAAGAVDKINPAIDELLAAFPKSYYFADAMILRARVAAVANDLEGAKKALAAVASAQGMNPRDLLRAEQARIFLTLETQKKPEEALAAYQKLVADAGRVDPQMGDAVKQLAFIGVGNTLLATRKVKEAGDAYRGASASKNADVLAGAYAGLGDIAFGEAKALREANKLSDAKAKLEEAVLHYLRVTTLYSLSVDDNSPVLRSLENQGRVFQALFELTGSKDVDLLDKALSAFWELFHSNDIDNITKRNVTKALRDLDQKKKDLLGEKKPDEKPEKTPEKKPDDKPR